MDLTERTGSPAKQTGSAEQIGLHKYTATTTHPPQSECLRTKTSVRPTLVYGKAANSNSKPGWLSVEITYGLYLSDHTILDAVDTELIVLSGIMIQNLKTETGWHLRGTRRIGVSHDDVETIQQCVSKCYIPSSFRSAADCKSAKIEKVAAFCGLRLTRVPRVKDIEHEVDAKL